MMRLLGTVATATLAASVGLSAAARADDDRPQFQSPSGNIRCVLEPSTALCQIKHFTYAAPPELPRDEMSGSPCPPGANGGGDFRLDQGKPGFIRCTYSALASGVGPWPTLDAGQTRSLGPMTCAGEPSGIRCTDTATGHFFRVSEESYDVG